MTEIDLRILGLAAPTLLPLLRRREEVCLNRIYGEYKNGKIEQLANLAEFAALRDQINDINRALRALEQGDRAHGKSTADDDAAGTAD